MSDEDFADAVVHARPEAIERLAASLGVALPRRPAGPYPGMRWRRLAASMIYEALLRLR